MTALVVEPGGALCGELRVPGDKSVSHRAVIFGALAAGTTVVSGFLQGEDSLHTLAAFEALGVDSEWRGRQELHLHGVGLGGLRRPAAPLYVGNSGTAMRLLCGVLAAQPFDSELRGDDSLSRRPMGRVAEPLRAMGARIELSAAGTAPVRVGASSGLHPLDYAMPVASAQVKSAILLAALYAGGETCIAEPAATRDHTERMLEAFGWPLTRAAGRVCVRGGGSLRATRIAVPADISSAAFFLVGASVLPGSDLLLRDVGLNPTRDGVLQILTLMGADIEVSNRRTWGSEPVADLRVRSAPLRGVEIPRALVPLAIDEFPALLVAAACAEGVTTLSGAAELRVKESDRIGAMADALQALGIDARPRADGMQVRGGRLRGGRVASRGDHRIAMAMAMAAGAADAAVTIEDTDNVATSYPGFDAQAAGAGLRVRTRA